MFLPFILASIFISETLADEPKPRYQYVQVCYNYNCKQQGKVKLAGDKWNQITEIFSNKSTNAKLERIKIARATALMEQLTGEKLGTNKDKAENNNTGEAGQMDCIDESTNTTRYLKLFAEKNWLIWHQVERREKRSPFFFDVHWTAVIKDKSNNKNYSVDSWFRDNGKEPIILPLKDWRRKR